MARVLIIEDSPSQAAIITEIVERAGHVALAAPELSKGIAQILRAQNPDIVLLDLVLLNPEGKQVADGFQICREIKRVTLNKVGVVIVSSKDDPDSTEWAKLQGADAFLHKPFVVDDLIQVMNKLLAR